MPTRRMLIATAAALPLPAIAQEWAPTRPLRLISPFQPGGAVDVLARGLAERMQPLLGQPVVVDSRPGANTIVGAEALARAAPDGHTLMVTIGSTVVNNPALYASLPYDPFRDFAPVMLLSFGSVLLAAPARLAVTDVRACVAWIRAQGRPVTYGSWGVGSTAHLYGELLRMREGLSLEHVPYRGEPLAIADMLAGRLDLTFASPVGAAPHVAAGTMRALGMVGERRSAAKPDLATFGEQGFAGFDLQPFTAAYVPAGTPRAAILRLNAALRRAAEEEETRARMLNQGQTPVLSSPEELDALQRRDAPRWAELIRASGARVE